MIGSWCSVVLCGNSGTQVLLYQFSCWSLEQWFLYFSMHQSHLECLLKHKTQSLVSFPRISDSWVWNGAREFVYPTNSQEMLIPLSGGSTSRVLSLSAGLKLCCSQQEGEKAWKSLPTFYSSWAESSTHHFLFIPSARQEFSLTITKGG